MVFAACCHHNWILIFLTRSESYDLESFPHLVALDNVLRDASYQGRLVITSFELFGLGQNRTRRCLCNCCRHSHKDESSSCFGTSPQHLTPFLHSLHFTINLSRMPAPALIQLTPVSSAPIWTSHSPESKCPDNGITKWVNICVLCVYVEYVNICDLCPAVCRPLSHSKLKGHQDCCV